MTGREPAGLGAPVSAGRPGAARDAEVEPAWFRTGLVVALAALVALGAVGLVLAVAGGYRFVLVVVLGAPIAAGLVVLARPWETQRPDAGRPATRAAAAAVVLAVAATTFAAARPSEHVLINRDPGSYTTTARWLATQGSLEVVDIGDPFVADGGLILDSSAVYREPGARLEFQFNHLLSVVMAMSHAVGGDGLMFRTPALLHGLALLALFALALRVLQRGWPALGVAATLAVTLPQLFIARDAYSEGVTQVLLFGALWLLATDTGPASAGRSLLAGLLLGGAVMARVDSLLYLTVVPVVAAWSVGAARGRGAAVPWRRLGALAAGAAVTATIGLVDVSTRGGRYYEDLGSEVQLLWAGLAATAVVATLVVVGGPHLPTASAWLRHHRDRWAAAAAAATIAAFGFLWIVRRRIETPHRSEPNRLVEGLQALEGVPVDATRRYAERSVEWLTWYLGPVTVVLGFAGAALLAATLVRGKQRRGLAFAVAWGAPAVLYLWRPSISPDHLWAMRRYLPIVLPGIILLAFFVLVRFERRAPRPVGRVALLLAATVIVATPAVHTWPLRGLRAQAGYAEVVRDACTILGPDAAALVLPGESLESSLPQALRAWCDVPVAAAPPDFPTPRIQELDRAWSAAGRDLWLVAGDGDVIGALVPRTSVLTTTIAVNPREPELTVTRRPDDYRPMSFDLLLAPAAAVTSG